MDSRGVSPPAGAFVLAERARGGVESRAHRLWSLESVSIGTLCGRERGSQVGDGRAASLLTASAKVGLCGVLDSVVCAAGPVPVGQGLPPSPSWRWQVSRWPGPARRKFRNPSGPGRGRVTATMTVPQAATSSPVPASRARRPRRFRLTRRSCCASRSIRTRASATPASPANSCQATCRAIPPHRTRMIASRACSCRIQRGRLASARRIAKAG